MQALAGVFERRTTTDVVFDQLHEEIVSLQLRPGKKLSETEVARRFGVSRQPVRDAFARLENLDLLLIRPQKATEVRGFSMQRISHARFVRLAVELEVIRHACSVWDDDHVKSLQRNLDQQQRAVDADQPDAFHALDYKFHQLICELGGHPLAFETIKECKQKIDRLCILSFGRENESAVLLEDHRRLADAIKSGSTEKAVAIARQHLSRLDETISDIYRAHPEYFE
ncbi:MAG: GntR family transcriptional regulator [Alphaproteobacteria bacterium]|nr:GntR family transcriptional regulator [Alphaproteobacteria bacterium]